MNHEADVLRELYEGEKRSSESFQESFYQAIKRVAELEAQKEAAYQDGRRHACALLSQLVYTSDGEPLDQAALLELCINVETDYGL